MGELPSVRLSYLIGASHLCALGSFPSRFSSFFFLSAIDRVPLAALRGDGDWNPQVQLGPAGVGSSDWGIKNGSIDVSLNDSSLSNHPKMRFSHL